jgi:peptidyl-prolyl cis-trans isomerase D
MLQEFRKFSRAFLYIVIAAFVGTIIFAWGADITRSKGQKGIVGEVDGEEIDYRVYSNLVDNYYQRVSQQSQREITHDELLQIRNQAWTDLITSMVNKNIFDRLGLSITAAELAEHLKRYPPKFIQQHPEFQNESGAFDYQKYLATMQDPRYQQFWVDLETMSREDLVTLKLQEIAVTGGRVTNEDVREEFIRENEMISIEFALVLKDEMDDPPVENDSSEVIEYYKSHPDRYRKPAEASVRYVEFKKEPTESDSLALKENVESIYDEIKDGADFAQLARSVSEDGSAQNGGDLGWFGEGAMVKPFEEAAFALKDSGDVSEPVQSEFGWHIILKTGERETEDGKKEVRASHILLKYHPSGQTITDLTNAAQAFIEDAHNTDFETAAAKDSLEVQTTGFFSEGAYAGRLGQSVRTNQFAFSHDEGEISKLIEEPSRFLVVQVAGYKPAGVRGIEDSYARANSDLHNKKLFDRAFERIKQVDELVVAGQSLDSACSELGALYMQSDSLTRNDPVIRLGRDPYFLGVAFELNTEEPWSEPIMTGKGAALIHLLDRIPANLEAFTAAQDTIQQQMQNESKQHAYNLWFEKVQNEHEVKDYRDELYGSSY